MDYEITVSEDNQYIRIRTLADITIDMVKRFSKDAYELSQETHIYNILSDERASNSLTTVTDTYLFAHHDLKSHNWRIAVLKKPDDSEYDCVETVMENAGFIFHIFTDEAEAIAWLTDKDV